MFSKYLHRQCLILLPIISKLFDSLKISHDSFNLVYNCSSLTKQKTK